MKIIISNKWKTCIIVLCTTIIMLGALQVFLPSDGFSRAATCFYKQNFTDPDWCADHNIPNLSYDPSYDTNTRNCYYQYGGTYPNCYIVSESCECLIEITHGYDVWRRYYAAEPVD